MTRGYAVALTIPDNAAFTALVTLQRLGVACDELQRAEIYLFDVDPEHVEALDRSVPMLETIYNPNKHRLRGCGAAPEPGEVWIGDWGTEVAVRGPALRIAGRELAGVRTLRRYTSWRLRAGGTDVIESVRRAAVEKLLLNPAYQEAIG